MATVTTNNNYYSDIASAIREKKGTKETYKPSEMAKAISSIETGGDSFYDAFWDNYQDNGKRNHYRYAFYRTYWNDNNFKPKYNITPSSDGQYIFQQCGIKDMKSILARQGVTLDFSKTPNLYYCFANSTVTHLPELTCSKCSSFQNMCNGCSLLVSIDNMIIAPSSSTTVVQSTGFAGMFTGCIALEEIRFNGSVINADISFKDSPKLSKESILSLFNALKSGGSGTVTLGATNLAKLTDTEKAIATEKGWSLV